MTDTLNRTLVIIWSKLAALLQPEQRDSLRLNLSLNSANWYQSCTFLAQEEEMKGGKKGGVCSAVCMAFCTRSQKWIEDPHWRCWKSSRNLDQNTVLYNYEYLRLRNLVVMSIPAVVENLTRLRGEACNQVYYVSNWHC